MTGIEIRSIPWLPRILGVGVVGTVIAALLLVGPPASPSATVRLVTAERGVVQSTVSATGNVQPAQNINLNFQSGGRLISVQVARGDTVTRGQILGVVDQTAARSTLANAEVNLTAAQIHEQQAAQVLSPEQQAADQAGANQSQTQVDAALRALTDVERIAAVDAQSQTAAVSQAQLGLTRAHQAARADANTLSAGVSAAFAQQSFDQRQLTSDQNQLASDQSQLTTDQNQESADQSKLSSDQNKQLADGCSPSGSSSTPTCSADALAVSQDQTRVSNDESKVSQDRQSISTDQSKISSDQTKLVTDANQITTARNTQAAGTVKDQQSIDTANNALANAQQSQTATAAKDQQSLGMAQSSVTSAQAALGSTVASNVAKGAPLVGAVAVAQTGVETAQLAVQTAQVALGQTELVAPTNGVVASVSARAGEFVGGGGGGSGSSASSSSGGSSGAAAGSSASSGAGSSSSGSGGSSSSTGFVVLTDLHGLQVQAGFSETDASKLRLNQSATISVNALPDQKLAAHVIAIDIVSTTTGGVVTYNATLQLDQTVPGLRPGMTATAQVVVSQTNNAISLPPAAITRSGGQQVVTVVRGGKSTQVPVVTGVTGDSSEQIVSGVNAGDQVAIVSAAASGAAGAGAAATGVGGRGAAIFGGGGLGGGLGGGGFGAGGAAGGRGGGGG